MNYLERKRKRIADDGLVPFESEEAALEALRKQHYCSDPVKVIEQEISREAVGSTLYKVIIQRLEIDPDEEERQFYIKAFRRGRIDLYRSKDGKLIVFLPDEVLEKWDKE